MCDIPLEISRQVQQLCFRLHLDPKSFRKVMGLQSCGSSGRHDFGGVRVPGEKSHLDVGPMERCRVYYKGEGGGFPPSPSRGESCVSVLLVARPNTKGAPTMH